MLDLDLRIDIQQSVTAKQIRKQIETVWPRKWAEISVERKLFSQKMLELETLHSRNTNCFRIAVV